MDFLVAHCAREIHVGPPTSPSSGMSAPPWQSAPRGRGAGRRAARPAGVESPSAGLRKTEDRDAETRPPTAHGAVGRYPRLSMDSSVGVRGCLMGSLHPLRFFLSHTLI